jgi:hypothetical protein
MKLPYQKIKVVTAGALLGLNLLLLMGSNFALAQQPPAVDIGQVQTSIRKVGPETVGGIVRLAGMVVYWTYILFFVLAVFFILFAAFTYLTAAGDPEKVGKAKNMLIYAVVAIAIAFLAVGFEKIIGTFLVQPGI